MVLLLSGSCHAINYDRCEIITGKGYTTGVNEGYYTSYSFYNYCPLCHHYNTVYRGIKRNDELTCSNCDADYSFSGKEKLHNPRAWLIKYHPKPKHEVEKVEEPVKELTPQEKFLNQFKEAFQTPMFPLVEGVILAS